MPSPDSGPERAVETRELRESVQRGLGQVPESARTLLVLRYFGDLTVVEMGRVLELPPSTVHSRLEKARGALRRVLGGSGYALALPAIDQVAFLGTRADAVRHLPGHRLYVHAALMESFGMVLVEAMGCGVPVAAGAVGGIPEVFSDGVEGVYWPLDDPTEGARRLIELLEDGAAYRGAALAARERFVRCFETDVVAGRLASFLAGVCG